MGAFGAELSLPLRASSSGAATCPPARSFFAVSRPEVQLLAFKPSESGSGQYVLRFQGISGHDVRDIKLITPLRISGAALATTLDVPPGTRVDLSNFSLRAWETLTVLVRVQPGK